LRRLAVLYSAFATAALGVEAPSAQERPSVPTFPAQAEAITADVVVLDEKGLPVRGLTRQDFTVLEDGKPQTIVGFEAREPDAPLGEAGPQRAFGHERVATNEGGASRSGRALAFLIDDLGTDPATMADVQKTVARWLEEKADPRDEVTLATTSGSAWWSDEVGRGRSDLLAVLERVRGQKGRSSSIEWMSDWEAFRIAVYEDRTGAAAASTGAVSAAAAGPPQAPSAPVQTGVGQLLERVFNRWLDTGACTRVPVVDPFCKTRIQGRAEELYRAATGRARAVLGQVERMSRGLAGARGRKSIVVFSEGFLNDPQPAFERAYDASRRANTAVYFVDARGLFAQPSYTAQRMTPPQPGDIGLVNLEETVFESAGLEAVAEETGGASIRNTNDLLGGVERVADESSSYYLLGYQAEKPLDGKWHKLEVRVGRPGLRVRARRGYYATPPSATLTVKRMERPRKAATRPLDPAVMTGGADATIALRLAPYVLEADGAGLARVLVALEIETSKVTFEGEGNRRRAALDLTILGMSRDQPKLFPVDESLRLDLEAKAVGGWLSLSREIRLPTGIAQVRALVRDVATGRAGAVAQRLEVPSLDRPYLATPVLTDRMDKTRGPEPRLVPVAHRQFRPGSRLYCSYEVFGMTDAQGLATTTVSGGYTLQAVAGKVVASSPPTPIDVALGGRVIRMLTLPLDGLEDGDYELALEIVDRASGRTLISHEPFSLRREAQAAPSSN
jgi:VWFA-related protein